MNLLISNNIKAFKEYSNFQSIKDFNNHIEQWMVEYKHEFTRSELIALKRLVRFSAKVYGVANAKIGTLLKAINEKMNGFGISRSTFERMLRKAKQLEIITVKNTTKSKGGKGHNVYVFNRIDVLKTEKMTYCESSQIPCESKDEQEKFEEETSNLSKTNNIKNINKRIASDFSLDHTFVSDSVPKEFTDVVKCFFDDAKKIEEYWKMVKIDTYKIKGTLLDDHTILHTAIHSFKQMIGKLKKGKVKKPIAYFTGTLNKQITDICSQNLMQFEENIAIPKQQKPSKLYNWLE